jgi:hypothetical protein
LNVTDDIKGKDLDIDDLDKVIYNMWHQVGGKPSADNKDINVVFAAFTGLAMFAIIKAIRLLTVPTIVGDGQPGGGNKKFMDTCNNCGEFGRMKTDCWALKANKSKRRNGYRGNTYHVAAAVGTN